MIGIIQEVFRDIGFLETIRINIREFVRISRIHQGITGVVGRELNLTWAWELEKKSYKTKKEIKIPRRRLNWYTPFLFELFQ